MTRRRWTGGITGLAFVSAVAIVTTVLVAALVIASYFGQRAVRAAERRGLEVAADLTAQFLAARGRTIAGGARVFVQGPYFRSLVAQPTHEDMVDQTFEAQQQLEADWVFFVDERGTLLAKSDEPAVVGVPLGSIPLVAGALEGRVTSGFGVSRDTLLFQTVAVPIISVPGAAPIGVLVASKLVDRELARDVHAATGADVVFYTLDASGAPRAAPSSLEHASDAADALSSVVARNARVATIGGVSYALHGARLTTAGGEMVGGFIVARPERETAAEMVGMRRSLLAAGLLGLFFAAGLAWVASRGVTRPTRALAEASARALEGDYDGAARRAADATAAALPNEMTALGRSLTTLLRELREKQSLGAAVSRAGSGAEPMAVSPDDEGDERGTERRRAPRTRASGPSRGRGVTPAMLRPLGMRWTPRSVTTLPNGAVVADRYEIEDVRGVGGNGIVYRALDRTLGETVALKMLRPELLGEDPLVRDELKRELRLARRVSHRNVVRLHDLGTSDGVPFLTMEYVEGTSLSAVIAQRGALPAEAVLALARQLVRALEAAHEQGIIHGDLKPANLLVTLEGQLKVTDFGVASLARRPRSTRAPSAFDDVETPRLAGALLGTPEYLAPELLVGATPDPRTDLYAAGMVLHECLTGATPFQRDTPRGFLAQKLDPPASAPAQSAKPDSAPREQPGSLAEVIAWMTAADATDRPSSAADVASALGQLG